MRAAGVVSLLIAAAAAGCASDVPWGEARHAIIDGAAAPELTGVVHVRHPLSSLLCSGVVIAPTLVVTAQHCAFRELEPADEPLAAEGFQIGFGPDVESLELREVSRLAWVGMPTAVDVQAAVEAGEDIAVLTLTEPVPAGTHIHTVRLDYTPALSHTYELVGYGLSSLVSWDSGIKRVTTDAFVGYDPASGILQIGGQGACNGDSGGPVLFGAEAELVGVISQIGGTPEGDFCVNGMTFATTVRNTRVRALLEAELAALPPCAERGEICANGQDEDCDGAVDEGCGGDAGGAAGASGASGAGTNGAAGGAAATAGHGDGAAANGAAGRAGSAGAAGAGVTAKRDEGEAGGCGCRATRREGPAAAWVGLVGVAVGVGLRRRRGGGPNGPGIRLGADAACPTGRRRSWGRNSP